MLPVLTNTGPARPLPHLTVRNIAHSLAKCMNATTYVANASRYKGRELASKAAARRTRAEMSVQVPKVRELSGVTCEPARE